MGRLSLRSAQFAEPAYQPSDDQLEGPAGLRKVSGLRVKGLGSGL